MNFTEYLAFIQADLFRYYGRINAMLFFKAMITSPGYKYTFWLRTANYLKHMSFIMTPLYLFVRIFLRHYEYKYGISIPYNTRIGKGLYIGHFGGIVVHYEAKIGSNCNINHGVTIGETYGGRFPGVPIIGDNVYVGPGAKIIGGITIGSNSAIGANCVVTKSVPESAVVVGVPGEIRSFEGATAYVVNKIIAPELEGAAWPE